MFELFLIVLGLLYLIFASIQDLRKNEVANWLSFSLIIFGLVYRLFYSLVTENFNYLWFGLFGLVSFVILGEIFYYSRVFAGGDVKLLRGLGVILPLSLNFVTNIVILVTFIILMLFIGGIYGLVYSGVLSLINLNKFKKEFLRRFKQGRNLFLISGIFIILSLIFAFMIGQRILFLFPILFLLLPLMLIYSKSIENVCMIRKVSYKDVVVGDWLNQEIKIGKTTIKPNWEGLSESQVNLIKKSRKNIWVKYGIPFVPSFLVAFILLLYLRYSSWSIFQLFF